MNEPDDRSAEQPDMPPPEAAPRKEYEELPAAPAYSQSQYAQAPEPLPMPKETDWATKLLLVTAVLGIISMIIGLADKSGTLDAIRKAQPHWSEKKVNDAYNSTRALAIVFGGVFFLLYVWMFVQLRRGKNWARIVVTVLLGLGIIGGLGSLSQPAQAASKTLSVLTLIVDIGVVVCLYLRPSVLFFASHRRIRPVRNR